LNKDIFVVVEALPEAEGGMNTFYSHVMSAVDYPSEALQKRIEGRVDVQFVVNKDGSLSDITVVNGIGAGCDEEAVKAIRNAPSFKSGHQGGKPVRVRMIVPIMFKLEDRASKVDNNTQGTISVGTVQPKNESFKVTADFDNGEWSGNVFDEEGEALPGVNVLVEGTTTGTVSDLDGAFKVKADASRDLYLSFVGYESVRLKSR
jgi:TonB family protein